MAEARVIEAWNTVLFDKFVRFKDVILGGVAGHSRKALELYPPNKGARALDLGCGFGDTTAAIAKLAGSAVGVDCAQSFIDAATREWKDVPNASFQVRDIEEDDLGGPYDYVFSRFGTMFFASPVRALRNVRRAMSPKGELCMIVWRKRQDNPWVHAAELVVREILPDREEKKDDITCGPGPFSMSSADVVSDQLLGAGFRDCAFERHDVPILIGRTIDEAIDFAMNLGPAGEIVRLAAEEGEREKPRVIDALRKTFQEFQTKDGIVAPSSAWFVSALV